MILKFFFFSILFLLYAECYTIKKIRIVKNNVDIINKNKSDWYIRKYKKNYTYNKFKINLSSEYNSINKKTNEQNNISQHIKELYKKNYIKIKNSFIYIKNILSNIKENLFKVTLKKQIIISVAFFFLHFYLLSEHFLILFPYQLIPNHSNILMSLDINNTLFLLSTIYFLKDIKTNFQTFRNKLKLNRFILDLQENKRKNILSISVLLIASYILSGYASIYTEKVLSILKLANITFNENIIKSLQILSGHFIWVFCSYLTFRNLLYPYFKNNKSNLNFRYTDIWYFKVIYGYLFSHFIFNIVDIFNNFILNYFTSDDIYSDNSIDEIVHEKEFLSTFLCIISPCFSAPFFEEFIYRFFVLKSLNLFMNINYAVVFSSLFFAIHHLNIFNLIPLFFLSFFWSYIYIYTDNILVTMLIHSFWNIYVFLTSLYN
ncbi:protease, putative [Plasmodium sp. gorilla clade G2]|uniref:protease, putative n=1 Tax=Plasmodium sp. gorilla clade G2 TaxID=880535 RepID=UPI000D21E881|nr:protease, putative [Plasmodium sp. gorilla clade G2]SOV14154.1 protease, putative [Plasmodium sp. gorilla clade G2]